MKALLLAAGYATRLYPLTLNKPKPLLPVAGRPVIEFILDLIEPIGDIDEVFIVTNSKFFNNFKEWAEKAPTKKKIVIVNDHTTSDENRLGATGDMEFVIKNKDLKDDLLILAGDNIFRTSLEDFIGFSVSKRPFVSIGLYDVGDLKLAVKYGIVSLDGDDKITKFSEKPAKPSSTLAAKCLYFFPREKVGVIEEYMASGASHDAPGYFLEWLSTKEPVFGYTFSDEKWYDIGDKKSYEEADREFRKEN